MGYKKLYSGFLYAKDDGHTIAVAFRNALVECAVLNAPNTETGQVQTLYYHNHVYGWKCSYGSPKPTPTLKLMYNPCPACHANEADETGVCIQCQPELAL